VDEGLSIAFVEVLFVELDHLVVKDQEARRLDVHLDELNDISAVSD
jgi:hypothetical protein